MHSSPLFCRWYWAQKWLLFEHYEWMSNVFQWAGDWKPAWSIFILVTVTLYLQPLVVVTSVFPWKFWSIMNIRLFQIPHVLYCAFCAEAYSSHGPSSNSQSPATRILPVFLQLLMIFLNCLGRLILPEALSVSMLVMTTCTAGCYMLLQNLSVFTSSAVADCEYRDLVWVILLAEVLGLGYLR